MITIGFVKEALQRGVVSLIMVLFVVAQLTGQPRTEISDGRCTSCSHEEGSAREPAIAISHTGTMAVAWLGYDDSGIVNATTVYTRHKTDGGSTWSTSTNLTGDHSTLNDEKLAYRRDNTSSRNPELLAVFHSFSTGANEIALSHSGNDGGTWVRSNNVAANSDGSLTLERPCIGTDRNGTSNSHYYDYAYIAWSEFVVPGYPGSNTVQIATLQRGSTNANSPITIATGTTAFSVDACDVAVGPDGAAYLLWRKRTSTAESLYIAKSTDGGTNWTSNAITVAEGILLPAGVADPTYKFYPSLTISGSECFDTSLFVAYAAKTSLPSTNPSDMWLTTAKLTAPSSWTANNINADALQISGVSGNANLYTYQYAPSLAPDGYGGVFLVYYVRQPAGSPIIPRAVLYESAPHWQHRPLNLSPSNVSTNPDYVIGLALN